MTADALRSVVLMAIGPPLVYCAGMLYFFESRLPWPGPWLLSVSAAGAFVGLVVNSPRVPQSSRLFLSKVAEPTVRYVLALMIIQFALNKLIPGQFLLYNRDFDLPLRELPPRRLAWHFLGYSRLYNGFVAGVELAAGVSLCSRRTVRAGALLSLAALVNVVVVDTSFGIAGALPIATAMACAALALVVVHVDWQTLQPLVWRRRFEDAGTASRFTRGRFLRLVIVTLVIGYPIYKNLATRRGLSGQVSPAGRWEIVECRPALGLALCVPGNGRNPPVLYIEIGQWGQLTLSSERRSASFKYDKARRFLDIRVAGSPSSGEPELALNGIVEERDTAVVLDARADGVPPFQVHLRRTHRPPWPPVRAY